MALPSASYDLNVGVEVGAKSSDGAMPRGTENSELTEQGNGNPPSYESAQSQPPQYTNDPPPSYNSVIQAKIEKVRGESDGHADFAKRMVCLVCCGSIASIIGILLSLAVPIASLVIGVMYLHDCPRERFIPIFLIVSGVFGILRALASGAFMCWTRKDSSGDEEGQEEVKRSNPIDGIVGCFLFAWMIAGSVWVYRIHNDYQSADPSGEDYCQSTLYLYAFWSLTAGYIIMALALCCSCACGIAIMCCAGSKE